MHGASVTQDRFLSTLTIVQLNYSRCSTQWNNCNSYQWQQNKIKDLYTKHNDWLKKIKENTFYINYKNNADTLKWYQVIIWKDVIVFIIYYHVTLQSITHKSWKSRFNNNNLLFLLLILC